MNQRSPFEIADAIRSAHTLYLSPHGGFLPSITPIQTVSEVVKPFADACALLPRYLGDQSTGCRAWLDGLFAVADPKMDQHIEDMTVLERSQLSTLLAVLGHGYRWNTIPAPNRDFVLNSLGLPKGLSEPWSRVSATLGQPMVGTLWSLFYCNWSIDGKGGEQSYSANELVYENMRVLHNFHGPPMDEQLRAFVMAFVLTEGRGATVINCLVDLIESAAQENEEACITHFEGLLQALKAMNHVFMQLIKTRVLDPATWLDNIQRPSVWGIKNKDGLLIQGPSGMQLGVMSCINTALDIRSESSLAQSVRDSRMYLPSWHRQFLSVFDEARPIIRQFVSRTDNTALRCGYNDALSAMALWKQVHHRRGSIYFKGNPKSQGMQTSTGLLVTEGENLLTHFEKSMEERIIETEQTKIIADITPYSADELEYLAELKACVSHDNVISADERRLLERVREQMGISADRAREIEMNSQIKSSFRPRELEYIAELELCVSSPRGLDEQAREHLTELALELKLSDERAAVLEAHLLGAARDPLGETELKYLDEVEFCLANDGRIKLDERRHLIRIRKKLGLSEERAFELEQFHLIRRA